MFLKPEKIGIPHPKGYAPSQWEKTLIRKLKESQRHVR